MLHTDTLCNILCCVIRKSYLCEQKWFNFSIGGHGLISLRLSPHYCRALPFLCSVLGILGLFGHWTVSLDSASGCYCWSVPCCLSSILLNKPSLDFFPKWALAVCASSTWHYGPPHPHRAQWSPQAFFLCYNSRGHQAFLWLLSPLKAINVDLHVRQNFIYN